MWNRKPCWTAVSNSKRRCTNCKNYFPAEAMYRRGTSGVCTAECEQQLRDKARTRHRNKQAKKAANREARRVYSNKGPSPDQKRAVRARDGGMCRRCGTHWDLHVHHVVFRSQGGPNAKSNLITLCENCHSHVHMNSPAYWRRILLACIWATYVEGTYYTTSDMERRLGWKQLFEKRIIEDGCWIWTGATTKPDPLGYGRLRLDGEYICAHVLAYRNTYGHIPPGMKVLHSCDRPRCFNPEHLRLGTQADNMRDMKDRGRERKASGETHGRAKLTLAQVQDIRLRRKAGESRVALSEEFGVNPSQISHICSGRNWK